MRNLRMCVVALLWGITGGICTYNGAPLLSTAIIMISLNVASNIILDWYVTNEE